MQENGRSRRALRSLVPLLGLAAFAGGIDAAERSETVVIRILGSARDVGEYKPCG